MVTTSFEQTFPVLSIHCGSSTPYNPIYPNRNVDAHWRTRVSRVVCEMSIWETLGYLCYHAGVNDEVHLVSAGMGLSP